MTLEERIERLESELKHTKRQKRLTWGVLAIVSVLVVVMVSPQGNIAAQSNVSNEIRTRQIVIVDENGKPRSILAMGKNGPGLALRGENGEMRSSLNTDKEGSRLSIYDENGEPRIVLVMDIEGPRLGLYDEKGSPRASPLARAGQCWACSIKMGKRSGPRLKRNDSPDDDAGKQNDRLWCEVSKSDPQDGDSYCDRHTERVQESGIGWVYSHQG